MIWWLGLIIFIQSFNYFYTKQQFLASSFSHVSKVGFSWKICSLLRTIHIFYIFLRYFWPFIQFYTFFTLPWHVFYHHLSHYQIINRLCTASQTLASSQRSSSFLHFKIVVACEKQCTFLLHIIIDRRFLSIFNNFSPKLYINKYVIIIPT